MLILRDTDLKTHQNIYYTVPIFILYSIMESSLRLCIEKIFKIQKNILRLMTFRSWRFLCKPIYRELKIITVPYLIL